jgi:hypothetical protein
MNTERGMSTKRTTALLAVLLALVVCIAIAPARAQRPSFTLAVLRQDGILLPFATYDGRWKNYWPEPRPTFEVPISLEDVEDSWWPDKKPQVDWTLWLPDGESRPLKALVPAWVRAQCLANIGLRTDYRHPDAVAPPDAAPYPKVGLAVTATPGSEPRVEPIAIVDEDSQDWRWLRGPLTKQFNDAENEAIRRAGFKHPYGTLERVAMPVTPEALYRTPDTKPGDLLYYYEIVRRYPERDPKKVQDPPCDLVTFAWGSTQRSSASQTHAPAMVAVVNDCNRWNATFMFPFGVLRWPDGRPIWVGQMSGWGHEFYIANDLKSLGRSEGSWQTFGGWCR